MPDHSHGVKVNMSAHPAPTAASKPAPHKAPADSPAPVKPATPPAAATPAPTPEPTAAPRSNNLFALALVVVATLPVGLGVGAACRPKPVVEDLSHKKRAAEAENQALAARTALETRRKADDLFQAGEVELALQLYQSKESAEPLRPSDRLSFKIAICREALGQWDEALATFRTLASRDDRAFRAAALLAQARIGLSRHDFPHARAIVREFLHEAAETKAVPDAMLRDAQYLGAIASLLDGTHAEFIPDGLHPIPPLHNLTWPLNDALQQLSQFAEHEEGDDHESPVATSTDVLGDTTVWERLLTEAVTKTRRTQAEALLHELFEKAPRHWLAGRAKLAMAFITHDRRQLAEAISQYDKLLERASTSVSVIAAYNRGLVQFQLKEYRAASDTLGRAVDGAPGQDLTPPALILRGRALLELGDYETAMFELKRAADLNGRPEDQAWATALSGMAALRRKQPQVAATLMFHRRERLDESSARAAAAFINSLARFQSLESPDARDREALFLMRSLAALEHDESIAATLGSNGTVLIGEAYRELGLSEPMVAIYSAALAKEIREPFASEMKFVLAEHAIASGDAAAGCAQLAELRDAPKNPWSIPAGLRLAASELSAGHTDECLVTCRDLLKRDTDRAPILRLMGSAYEQAGDLAKAAQCYAGNVP